MINPLRGEMNITSGFYRASGEYHGGVDLACDVGSEVLAVNNGRVRYEGLDQYGGAYIDIVHSDNSLTRYLHLSRIDVQINQQVTIGQVIGLSGGQPGMWGAGLSTGPHLHFEIWDNYLDKNTRLDPAPYLSTNNQIITSNNDDMNKENLINAINSNSIFDPETKRTLTNAVNEDNWGYLLSYSGSQVRSDAAKQYKDLSDNIVELTQKLNEAQVKLHIVEEENVKLKTIGVLLEDSMNVKDTPEIKPKIGITRTMRDVVMPIDNPPIKITDNSEFNLIIKKTLNSWISKIVATIGVFLLAKGILTQDQVNTINDPKMIELFVGSSFTCASLLLDSFRYNDKK